MENCELETHILINNADVKEGFFIFNTSKKSDFKRLCRRIGGENKLIKLDKSGKGDLVTEWMCQVPIEYLSRATFGIRQKKKTTQKQLDAAVQNINKMHQKKADIRGHLPL